MDLAKDSGSRVPGVVDEEHAGRIGREIFAACRKMGDGVGWIDRTMMELAMRDPRVKGQLFRLVDTLPSLIESSQITRHIAEYLGPVKQHLPWAAAEALDLLGNDGWASHLMAAGARVGTRRMARRFIAAEDAQSAIRATGALRKQNLTFTLDVLGEAVLSDTEALAYQAYYLDLIRVMADAAARWPVIPLLDSDDRGLIPKVNVSVKLSSLYSQFDPIDPAGTSAGVRDRLRPILRLAKERGVFVNIDMEQYAYKEVTLRIFREILDEAEFRTWGDIGIAIQAYLKDCPEDLRNLADWVTARGTPVWIRLVKGAYWDFETIIARQNGWPIPVWETKPQTDVCYESQAAFLIEHHHLLRPAIASHNIRSIAAALAQADAYQLKAGAIEFQLLYGMADPIKRALVDRGHRVRVYAPVGELLPGMAYFIRRLLENTSNESFLRAGFMEHAPEEKLLMNPLQLLRDRRAEKSPVATDGQRGLALDLPFENEPVADFSKASVRRAAELVLPQVRGQMGRSYPLVIGGQRIETGQWIESSDPSSKSRVVGRCAAATTELARQAVAAARKAFETWREVPVRTRAQMLLKAGQIIRERRFELCAWEVFECGKPWREADGDVTEAIDYCDYYARQAVLLSQGWSRNLPGEENHNIHEPRGVAAVIAPWNFPLAILLGMTAAAVVTGNTAVMKPAEQSGVIGAKLMEIFEQAGFPAGVINLLSGRGEVIGPVLINDPAVSLIAFTGSRSVGLLIQEQASKTPPGQTHVKRVITEMGGKNAVIIDDDADLDEAVHGVIAGAFGYAGQKCSACSRAIVLEGVYDTFASRLTQATRSLKVGPAEDPAYYYWPVIDEDAYKQITTTIAQAIEKRCGRLAVGGESPGIAAQGWFIAPHVFVDVDPESFLAQKEIFGPVLSVIRARHLDEALAIANGTQYALTGGLYSRSPSTIARVSREFRVGNLYINRKITGALVERQPFGGYKLSGIGSKAGGPEYLMQFTWPRTITTNTLRRGFAPEEAEGLAGGI